MEEYYVSSNGGRGQGGLGNQLYFFAIAIEYGHKFNKKPIFFSHNLNTCKDHGIFLNSGWNEFLSNKLTKLDLNHYNLFIFYEIDEKNDYEELINIPNKNVYIGGYRQSWKYYSEYTRNYINELIYSNKNFVNTAKKYYNNIKSIYDDNNDDNYAFIHIRRGDMLSSTFILNYEYYEKVLKIINKDIKIIVFSDDIEWCINNFKLSTNKIHYVSLNNIYIELILMTMIKNGILNYITYKESILYSTYSWWGAYLGDYKNKNIYYDGTYKENKDNFYLPEWKKII